MTMNAMFITRRRTRSCSSSVGSYIRLLPRMPPGAEFSGRFILGFNHSAVYCGMRIRRARSIMQLELNEQERAELVSLLTAAHGEVSSEIHHAMEIGRAHV